ncbi:RluA family pseudouridine synthase [Hippea maritima]|nr:RluA family pseudouridine synthase [Hippea maritima]
MQSSEIVIERIDEVYVDKRVDKVVSEILEIPRNQVQNYIKDGFIKVCSRFISKSYKLKYGDCLSIIIPPPKNNKIEPNDAPIKILFEDEDVVVVEKPAGIVVHPGAACEDVSVVSALKYRGVRLSSIGAPLRGGVVHRIDKDTSGVIVLAKNDRAHFFLAKQFFEHSIERRYIGVVGCHLKQNSGEIDKPIGRHPKNRKLFAVVENGKEAITFYKLLKRLENYDVVMFKLQTGRTHQIRVHMKYLGCPLVGDATYGGVLKEIKRQALHAFVLGFRHPWSGKFLKFYSKLPEDMRVLIGG